MQGCCWRTRPWKSFRNVKNILISRSGKFQKLINIKMSRKVIDFIWLKKVFTVKVPPPQRSIIIAHLCFLSIYICLIVSTNLITHTKHVGMTVCKYGIYGDFLIQQGSWKLFYIYTFHCDTNVVWLTLTFITIRTILCLFLFVYLFIYFAQLHPGIHKGIQYLSSLTSGRCGNFYSVKPVILGVTTTIWRPLGKHEHNSPNGNQNSIKLTAFSSCHA